MKSMTHNERVMSLSAAESGGFSSAVPTQSQMIASDSELLWVRGAGCQAADPEMARRAKGRWRRAGNRARRRPRGGGAASRSRDDHRFLAMKSEKTATLSETHLQLAAADRALAEGERIRGRALLALAKLLERAAELASDERISSILKHQADVAHHRAETSSTKATTHEEEAKAEQAAAQVAEQRARMAPSDEPDVQGGPSARGPDDLRRH